MRTRVALLSSPVFLAAVALLAVNDHVLKEHYPGLVTGKLSDGAGLVVVAVLLAVISGNRWVAVVLSAAGFVALKTIPSVAIAATPVLGGRTLADPSDLVALVVLVPACWWLGVHLPDQPGDGQPVLGVLGGSVALLALTATSCGAPPQVVHLSRSADGSLLAGTGLFGDTTAWAVSRDGRTWARTRAEARRPFSEAREACLHGGTCFRVLPGDRVESRTPGSGWHTEFRYTEEQDRRRSLRRMNCAGAVPTFDSITLAGSRNDQHVVVGMGPDGVLWRAADGHWERRAVLSVEPTRLDGPSWFADLMFGASLAVPLLLLAAAVVVRLVTGSWNRWLWVATGVSVLVWIPATGFLEMALDYTVAAPVIVVLAVVALVASAIVARFGPKPRPIAGWYQDPEHDDQLRWWDSRQWTEHRHPKVPTGR